MTTITEILAEAFNRVKAEHGVTLSRVEYVDTGGVLGLNFKAAGSAKGTVHRVAPQSAPYHVYSKAEFKPQPALNPVLTEQQLEELKAELPAIPHDATHVYDGREWAKFTVDSNLAVWDDTKDVYIALKSFDVSLLYPLPINPA